MPRDAEHQPVSGVFTRDVGTLCTNRSLLPFKGKTREDVCSLSPNHGERGTDGFSAVLSCPPFFSFFFTAYVKLVVVVEVLINSVPLKLAKVYTKRLI